MCFDGVIPKEMRIVGSPGSPLQEPDKIEEPKIYCLLELRIIGYTCINHQKRTLLTTFFIRL